MLCGGPFNEDEKVRDDCHFSGKYRGAAQNNCNLKFRSLNIQPVIIHNLSRYDSHLIILKKKILSSEKDEQIVFLVQMKSIYHFQNI